MSERARMSGRESSGDSLMDRMRRKKQQIDDARGKYWKTKEGDNYVRILPSWKGQYEEFYYETPTHYGVGPNGRTLPCLGQWDEVCPVCKRAEQLSSSTNVDDQKRAQQLMPKMRVIMNVLPNNDPEGTVKLWSISPNIFSDLLSYYMNTRWGDFTDPKNGYCFNVSVKDSGRKMMGKVVYETKFEPDPEFGPIAKKMKRSDLYNIELEIEKNRVSRSDVIRVMKGEDIER